MQHVCYRHHHGTGTGSTPGTGTSGSPGSGSGGSTGTPATTTGFTGTGTTSTGTTGTGTTSTGTTGTGSAGTHHTGTGTSGKAGTSTPHITPQCGHTTGAIAAFPASGGLALTTAQLAGLVALAAILGAFIAGLAPWFIRRRNHPWFGR
jgi:hypothetical protein